MPTVLESVEEEEDGPARLADVQHRLQEMQTRIVSDVEKKLQEYSARWRADLADEVARQLSARFATLTTRSPTDEFCLKPLLGFRMPQVDSRTGSPVSQEPLPAPRLSTASVCPVARQRPCSPVSSIGVFGPRGEDSISDDPLKAVSDHETELQNRFAAIKDLIQLNSSRDALRASEKKGPEEAVKSAPVPPPSATVAAVLAEAPKPTPLVPSGQTRHARSAPSTPLSVGSVDLRASPAKSRSTVGVRSRSTNSTGKGESRQLHAHRATSRELNDILERRRSISEGRVHQVPGAESPTRAARSAQSRRSMSLRALGDDSPRANFGH